MLSFFLYCGFQIVFAKFSRFFLLLTSSSLLLYLYLSLSSPLEFLVYLTLSFFLKPFPPSSLLPKETQIQRQAALHDCLPPTLRLLGNGRVRKKNILYCADQSCQGRITVSSTCTTRSTNFPRMDPSICTIWVPIHLCFNQGVTKRCRLSWLT